MDKKHLEDFNTAIILSTGEEAEFIAEVVRSFQGPWEDDISLDSSLNIGHLDLTQTSSVSPEGQHMLPGSI